MSAITAIKDGVDIIEVAQRFMVLRKRGKSHKGLCPFHSEKTPSFNVYPEGTYHCFGCKSRGDVIDLYAHFNGVDTKTAINRLCEEYGVNSGELSPEAKRREIEKFLRKKRQELQTLLKREMNAINEFMRNIKTDEELDHFGGLYHEISVMECLLHNVGIADPDELKQMYEHIPSYLKGIYENYQGEGAGR